MSAEPEHPPDLADGAPATIDIENALQKLAEQMLAALPPSPVPTWPTGAAASLPRAAGRAGPSANALQPVTTDDSAALAESALGLAPQLFEKARVLAAMATGPGMTMPDTSTMASPSGWPLSTLGSHVTIGTLRGGESPGLVRFGTMPGMKLSPALLRDLGAPSPTFGATSASPPEVGRPSGSLLRANELPVHDVFDPYAVRRDFPALHQTIHGRRLVWLDNAATTQKPQWVIDKVSNYYARDNSNVHRGAHTLAARATDAYEWARNQVQRFLGARTSEEIVFVRGTTEAINLVAQSWGRRHVGKGDEVLVTQIEHHSNIVPWQMLCREVGARLRPIPVDERGDILLDAYESMLGPRVKMVSITHVSNALGTVVPVEQMTRLAHRHGATVLVDGAQAVPHFRVDVQRIDADFYAFSGHKLFAPTGIGVLHGKRELLEEMPPWQGGGSMVKTVSFESTTFSEVPAKFEAGTGNIGGAVGLGAAIEYLDRIGFSAAEQHEHALLTHMIRGLSQIDGVRLIGTSANQAGVQSFVIDGLSVEQIGTFLDHRGIAVRAGHHCAQPSLERFGLTSTVRPSLAFYNTKEDVDLLLAAVTELASARRRGDFSPVGQR